MGASSLGYRWAGAVQACSSDIIPSPQKATENSWAVFGPEGKDLEQAKSSSGEGEAKMEGGITVDATILVGRLRPACRCLGTSLLNPFCLPQLPQCLTTPALQKSPVLEGVLTLLRSQLPI